MTIEFVDFLGFQSDLCLSVFNNFKAAQSGF